jgi:hypothetical protein
MELNGIIENYKKIVRTLIRKAEEFEPFDLIIGIPFYKETDTLKGVLKTAEEGIKKYFSDKRVLIIGAGVKGISEKGEEIFNTTKLEMPTVRKICTLLTIKGKGWGMRVVLDMANIFHTDVIFLDADLRTTVDKNGHKIGLLPETIKWIYEPIIKDGFDYICPYYLRHKWDGTITNFICYPLITALYGKKIRQPIGGEIGLSRRFVRVLLNQPDSWFTDIGTYGIDIWITVEAIVNRMSIAQTFLTSKIHDPSEGKLEIMFKQVANSLFERIIEHRGFIISLNSTEVRKGMKVRTFNGYEHKIEPEKVPFDWKGRIDYFREKFVKNKAKYKELLEKENFDYIESLYNEKYDLEFGKEEWAQIVYDFIIKYSLAHIENINFEKEDVLELMIPVYLLRAASFVKHTIDLSTEEAEKRIEDQVAAFMKLRKKFLKEFALIFGLIKI